MTRVFANDFETSLAPTGWTASATPPLLDTTSKMTGPNSMRLTSPTVAKNIRTTRTIPAGSNADSFTAFDFMLDTAQTVATIIWDFYNGTQLAYVRVNANRTLSILNSGGTVVATGSTVLALNTKYLIEVRCRPVTTSTGQIEVRINGVTETSNSALNLGTTASYELYIGTASASASMAGSFYFDNVRINTSAGAAPDNTWPGPLAPAPTPPTGFDVTNITTGQVSLGWTDTGHGYVYRVYMDGSLIGTTAASATSYNATGLTDGVLHTFTVKEYDGTTESTATSGVVAFSAPAAPTATIGETFTGADADPIPGWTMPGGTGLRRVSNQLASVATGGGEGVRQVGLDSDSYFEIGFTMATQITTSGGGWDFAAIDTSAGIASANGHAFETNGTNIDFWKVTAGSWTVWSTIFAETSKTLTPGVASGDRWVLAHWPSGAMVLYRYNGGLWKNIAMFFDDTFNGHDFYQWMIVWDAGDRVDDLVIVGTTIGGSTVVDKTGGASSARSAGGTKTALVSKSGGGVSAQSAGGIKHPYAGKAGGSSSAQSASGVKHVLLTKAGGASSALSGSGVSSKIRALSKDGGATSARSGGGTRTVLVTKASGATSARSASGIKHPLVTKAGGGASTRSAGGTKSVLQATGGLTVVEQGHQHVKLSWTAVPGATAYRIYRDAGDGNGPQRWETAGTVSGTTADLYSQNGVQAVWTVSAVVGGVEGTQSSPVTAGGVFPPYTERLMLPLGGANRARGLTRKTIGSDFTGITAAITLPDYDAEVLTFSPLLYWRMRETAAGTVADSSGNGRTAVATNVTYNTANSILADGGKAYRLGTTSKVVGALNLSTKDRIALVFAADLTGSADGDDLVTHGTDAGTGLAFGIYNNGDVGIGVYVGRNGTYGNFEFPCAVTGQHEYAVEIGTRDQFVNLYVDGVRVMHDAGNVRNWAWGTFQNSDLRVGADFAAAANLTGNCDVGEVFVLDRWLTPREHTRLYANTASQTTAVTLKCVVYGDGEGDPDPDQLLGLSSPVTIPAGSRDLDTTFTFASSITAPGDCWIGFVSTTTAPAWVEAIGSDLTDGKDAPVAYSNGALTWQQDVLWGAWTHYMDYSVPGTPNPNDSSPQSMTIQSTMESHAGKTASVINTGIYLPVPPGSQSDAWFDVNAENIIRHGSIYMLSASTGGIDQQDVIDGYYDEAILQVADAARVFGWPILLRFNWEMNGDWFSWAAAYPGVGTATYIAVWRHVRQLFWDAGAYNVQFGWCPNGEWATSTLPLDMEDCYPGDAYVDWVGQDSYQWGNIGWDNVFQATLARLQALAPTKPQFVGETAVSVNDSNKAASIASMFTELGTAAAPDWLYKIRMLTVFQSLEPGAAADNQWPFEKGTGAQAAFAAGIGDVRFIAASSGAQKEWPVTPWNRSGVRESYGMAAVLAPVGGTTVDKTGGASSARSGGGVKHLLVTKTGGASSALSAGGIKHPYRSAQGGASSALSAGGIKHQAISRSGGAVSALSAGGDKHLARSAQGGGAAPLSAGGVKHNLLTRAGGASAALSAGGTDSELRSRSGGASSALAAGASKTVLVTKTGGASLAARASGDTGNKTSLDVYGGAVATAATGGAKTVLVTKTGGATSARSAGGSRTALVTKAGGATSAASASGVKHALLTRAGGATLATSAGSTRSVGIERDGGAASPLAASGAKHVLVTKAGGSAAAASGGGDSDTTRTVTRDGGASLTTRAGGDKHVVQARSGGASASAATNGTRTVLITKTGGASTALSASGQRSGVAAKAGGASASLSASGVKHDLIGRAGGASSTRSAGGVRTILVTKTGGASASLTTSADGVATSESERSGGGILAPSVGSSKTVDVRKTGGGAMSPSAGGVQRGTLPASGGAVMSPTAGGAKHVLLTRTGGATARASAGAAKHLLLPTRTGGATLTASTADVLEILEHLARLRAPYSGTVVEGGRPNAATIVEGSAGRTATVLVGANEAKFV